MNKIIKNIAIQGHLGSFHHKAAQAFYGTDITVTICDSFAQIFKACELDQKADAGIMAIENSIAGTILPNYQLLRKTKFKIVGEIFLHIGQHLLALDGQQLADIKEIRSHHMAIKQCEEFLEKHPTIKIVETEDTALSAKHIAEQELKGVAAIAGEQAGSLYGLAILDRHIETVKNNFTRFLVLEEFESYPKDANKVSLLFSLQHKPSSLSSVLNILSSTGFNITKIQSFPIIEEEWKYYFALDIEFNSMDQLELVLKQLEKKTEHLQVLGIYKKGITI